MAAVIRPVGVYRAQLGHGGVAVLGPGEVLLAEGQILGAHRKAQLLYHSRDLVKRHRYESLDALYVLGRGHGHVQRVRHLQAGLAALHGVDEVALDALGLLAGHALKGVYGGRAHLGALALGEQLHALRRRVGALVVLAGQVLHGEHMLAHIGQLRAHGVTVGLGEHYAAGALQLLARKALHVVALEYAHARKARKAQRKAQIALKVLRLDIKPRSLLDIYPRNTAHVTRSLKHRGAPARAGNHPECNYSIPPPQIPSLRAELRLITIVFSAF